MTIETTCACQEGILCQRCARAAQVRDNAAVDAFAGAMKAKLADARAKGRGGWEDKNGCTQQHLSELLRGHIEKGDPCDVANFCCFLFNRGERIAAAVNAATPSADGVDHG